MEVYKRKVGYEDFGRTENLIVTGSTLYFPFLLTQNFEDIGIYTDVDNPVYEIVNLSGIWNLSGNTGTAYQKPCLILNNCTINFTSTPITYFNANNGTLTANVSGCAFTPSPTTVQWTGPGGFTSNNLTAGMNNLTSGLYTVKITDANCDITYATYFLQQPQSLNLTLNSNSSQTNVTTPGGCNGSASATVQGGQPPYTYLWYSGNTSNVLPGTNSSTTNVTNLCAGTYNVQITDFGGTIVSGLFNITEPQPLSGSVITKTNVSCAGGNAGSISVAAYGGVHPNGYTYILTGPTPQTITGSTGGATFNNLLACPSSSPCYNVQILDNVGNTTNLPVSITQPIAVTLGVTYKDSGCYDSSSGIINLTPTGGVSPYTVTILPTGSYPGSNLTLTGPITLSNLSVGTYTMAITDSIGCVGPTQTVTLKQRPILNVNVATPSSYNGYNIRCYSATTAITITSSYTSDPTTYSVPSNTMKYYLNGVLKTTAVGPGTVTITNVPAGNHSITVVDSATAGGPIPFYLNCSATTTVTLTQPPMALSFVGTPNIDIINIFSGCTPTCTGAGNTCVQGIVGVNGGVAPYTITWNMLPTSTSTTGPAWGTGITSNTFCTNMTAYAKLKVTVQDANGCIITSSINV